METQGEPEAKSHLVRRQTFTMLCLGAAFIAGEFGIVILDWIVERTKTPMEQAAVQPLQAAPELSSDSSARQTRSAN